MRIGKQQVFFVFVMLILTYLVLRQTNVLGESLFSSNADSYILPGTLHRDFSLIDTIQLYNYRIDEIFSDYPMVVKISIFTVVSSVIAMLIVTFLMFRQFVFLRQTELGAKEFNERFAKALRQIYDTSYPLEPDDLRTILGISQKYMVTSALEGGKWFKLYLQVIHPLVDSGIPGNYDNILRVMDELGMRSFTEHLLLKGSPYQQARALQIARLTRLWVSEGSLSRLINHKDKNLRRSARWLYMLVNMNNPYHFLASDSDLTTWDKMELHALLSMQLRENKALPSFIALVRNSQQIDYTCFLIREWALLEQSEGEKEVRELLKSNNESMKLAAIDAMVLRKDKKAVPILKKIYSVSHRNTRRKILKALRELHAGSDEEFLKLAFETADSYLIKLAALESLYHYDTQGKQLFDILYANAYEEEKILFKHVLSESKFPLAKFEVST